MFAGRLHSSGGEIAALERGETSASLFDKRERAVFALTGEILNTCAVEEHAFAVARELFSPRQTLELLLLSGYFPHDL